MKSNLSFLIIILLLVVSGTAMASPEVPAPDAQKQTVSSDAPQAALSAAEKSELSDKKADAFDDEYTEEEDYKDDDQAKEERIVIADPIQPVNRAMGMFNDRLYFWLLKPVAQGYKTVVPEPARLSVKNFFSNLRYPSRFVSCLLQTDFEGAATETGRFFINTVWGIGGLMDPAAGGEINLQMQDTDLGQTLGVYGVGQGFYIVWPFLGPSSPRDSIDVLGDQVLYPLSYANIWYASIGAWSFENVNKTSFRIGDYESLLSAAIDPYIAVRDAYVQYRAKAVKARRARTLFFKEAESATPAAVEIKKE